MGTIREGSIWVSGLSDNAPLGIGSLSEKVQLWAWLYP